MLRIIRRIYSWSRADPVDEELRGWNWDKPPLKPRAYLDLGVSEIASMYCETRRDVWLRRVMGVKPILTDLVLKGKYLHEAVSQAVREVSKLVIQSIEPWDIYETVRNKWRYIVKDVENTEICRLVEKTYKYTLITLVGEIAHEDLIYGSRKSLITFSEYKVDGSNLGLSTNLSIDLITEGGVIVDFKYGIPRDFHKLSITGYALALESEYEIPHDYGLLIYVYLQNGRFKTIIKPVYINSHLRKWFITERDSIIDMLLEKREPPKDTHCNTSCPYFKVCWS